MSFTSKKTIAAMMVTLGLVITYVIYGLGSSAPAPEDLQAWAALMLVFIGIAVGAAVVIQILAHIAAAIGFAVKEPGFSKRDINRELASLTVEDERNKQIEHRATHYGYYVSGLGVVLAFVSLALGVSAVAALHIIFAAFALGSLVESALSIYHHERG